MQIAPVVGFCGYAGSGKTTAALHLSRVFGYRRERLAGPLKAMLYALGLTEAELDGDLKEAPCALLGGKTPRWAMQSLGTNWGRDLISPDLWSAAWRTKIDAALAKGEKVVCDDIRFPNEVDAIRERGGLIIRISSPRAIQSDHISESMNFTWDRDVQNDLSRESLFRRLSSAIWMEESVAA